MTKHLVEMAVSNIEKEKVLKRHPNGIQTASKNDQKRSLSVCVRLLSAITISQVNCFATREFRICVTVSHQLTEKDPTTAGPGLA